MKERDILKRVLAVDLDGTITEPNPAWDKDNFPLNYEDHPIGRVRPYAREALMSLRLLGWKIIIWTTRTEEDRVAAFLDAERLPYDTINKNVPEVDRLLWHSKFRSPRKIFYTRLLDDRAGFGGDWEVLLMREDWTLPPSPVGSSGSPNDYIPPETRRSAPCSCKFHEAIASDPRAYSSGIL